MTADPIADPDGLVGRELYNQLGQKLGEIEDTIEAEDGEVPRWVTLQIRTGIVGGERVAIPVARIKEEDGRLEVPYSDRHIRDAPNPEDPGAMSEDDEAELLTYYGVERGDQPDVSSYSTQGTREVAPEDVGEPVGDPEDEGEEAENASRGEPADARDEEDARGGDDEDTEDDED